MPNGSFTAGAVVAKRILRDDFQRTDAGSWGSGYTVEFLSSGGVLSVDGSVGRLTAAKGADLLLDEIYRVAAGFIQFDFYVPANISDIRPYFAVGNGSEFPAALEVYQASGSTWEAYLWTRFGDFDPEYTFTPEASTWYRAKGVFSGYAEGPIGVKVWKVSDPEPDAFSAVGIHASPQYALTNPLDWYDLWFSFSAPTAEQMGFDNFEVWSLGTPEDPTSRDTFTASAVIRRPNMPGSGTLDAILVPRNFALSAWIIGSRLRHDRTLDHFGTQLDNTITISGPVGRWPTGTDLHTVLLDLVGRLTTLESANREVRTFSMSAFILPSLRVDAVILKAQAASATLDAYITGGLVSGFAMDAWLLAVEESSFTMGAWLIDDVCP